MPTIFLFAIISFLTAAFYQTAQAQQPAVMLTVAEVGVSTPDMDAVSGQMMITVINASGQDLMDLRLTLDSVVAISAGHTGIPVGLLSAGASVVVQADYQTALSPEMTMEMGIWRVEYNTVDGASHSDTVIAQHQAN